MLILFSRAGGYKPRYDVTRENLYSIVLSAKEKIESTNLLAFYIERINNKKGINKYLNEIINDKNIEKYADTVIAYLDQFKPKFISELKKNEKLKEYLTSKNKLKNQEY